MKSYIMDYHGYVAWHGPDFERLNPKTKQLWLFTSMNDCFRVYSPRSPSLLDVLPSPSLALFCPAAYNAC